MTPSLTAELGAEIRQQISIERRQIANEPAALGLVPLRITCVMSSCKHGTHCLDYLRKPVRGTDRVEPGQCRDCRGQIAVLPEPDGRRYGDPSDVVDTCVAMQGELIRAHYWHVAIDRWSVNEARRLGKTRLHAKVAAAVTKALHNPDPAGRRQVPYIRSIVAYAQHATATCCDRCAAYWHGLPLHTPPTTAQLEHAIAIACTFIDVRIPWLHDDPEPNLDVGIIRTAQLQTPADVATIDNRIASQLITGADPTGLLRPLNTSLLLVDGHGADGGFVAPRARQTERVGI